MDYHSNILFWAYVCINYFSDQARGLNSNTVICYECGLRNLRDLAYQYRKDIPNSELPGIVDRLKAVQNINLCHSYFYMHLSFVK